MLFKNDFGVWQIDLTVDGSRVRKSTRTKDEAIAKKIHAKIESEMLLGTYGLGAKPTTTFDEAFRKACITHWRGAKSAYKIEQNWKLIKEAGLDGSMDVTKFTSEHLLNLEVALTKAGNSNATINRKMATLKKLLNLCVDWQLIQSFPRIKIKKEPESRHRELSSSEESAMITFFAERQLAIGGLFEFLLYSASRLSEALKLEWEDVDFRRGVLILRDTKSGDRITKPLTIQMKRVLETRKRFSRPFPYTVPQAEHYWKMFRQSVGKQADKNFVIHSLRHTCASRLVVGGVDLKRVQGWLGHKAYQTTLKYAQLQPKHLLDVVEELNKQFDHSLSLPSTKRPSEVKLVVVRSEANQEVKKARVVKLVDTRDLKSKSS